MSTSTIQSPITSFLASWQDRPDYIGALLTGSYANDTADERSDIDLRILYSSESSFQEMGECMIDGKCVSFVGMSVDASCGF